jgi:hypothetical protein
VRKNIPSYTLQFKLTQKLSKSSTGTLLELHVSVKWITVCSQKGFREKQLGVLLCVKEYLTVNHKKKKTLIKYNMPGNV